jgi:WD40 repeat protein
MNQIACLQPLPNGNLISAGRFSSVNSTSFILVWNVTNGSVSQTLNGHSNSVTSLSLIDARTLASGSLDASIILWNVTTSDYRRVKTINTSLSVLSLKSITANDSKPLLASGHVNGHIKIWDVTSGQLKNEFISPLHEQNVTSLEIISDQLLASNGLNSNGIALWNLTR